MANQTAPENSKRADGGQDMVSSPFVRSALAKGFFRIEGSERHRGMLISSKTADRSAEKVEKSVSEAEEELQMEIERDFESNIRQLDEESRKEVEETFGSSKGQREEEVQKEVEKEPEYDGDDEEVPMDLSD
ncbi:hypothetical protein CERZMDRAFT_95795 [Cercospora zeae-maydis SCOH1-5]|uniref:Uncharacterized protein n=1 Tax=Cercospora zeae-maydis SCOH1-5 TaxID=717836 RepID=A0A6A6FM52_9PEZI|nr:hypothetical protein CERZMDRAFT_95795 [Cercospora zeae-maydis SCOH1-5]